jgi:hypothetical protein
MGYCTRKAVGHQGMAVGTYALHTRLPTFDSGRERPDEWTGPPAHSEQIAHRAPTQRLSLRGHRSRSKEQELVLLLEAGKGGEGSTAGLWGEGGVGVAGAEGAADHMTLTFYEEKRASSPSPVDATLLRSLFTRCKKTKRTAWAWGPGVDREMSLKAGDACLNT